MKQYPDRIKLIEDNLGNLGVVRNVFEILKYSSSDYIMLCDQDDIWLNKKIATLLKCIKKKEKGNREVPILVHSEAIITDEKLNIIHTSFSKYCGLNRTRTHLCNLLQKNVIQGASSIFNRSLLMKAHLLMDYKNNEKKTVIYHDLWFAVLATIFGEIYFFARPLMYYRQHNHNLVGAKGKTSGKGLGKLSDKEFDTFRYDHYLTVYGKLCDLLNRIYKDQFSKEQLAIIEHFKTRPSNMYDFFRLQLYKYYSIKDILLMVFYGIEKW
jgi:glycosyltransferase involved in cell wall biosynthesis